MRQFILPEDWDGGPSCLVEGGRARYLARVLRLRPGDSFPALDSGGRSWTCSVAKAEPDSILLAVVQAEGDAAYFPDARHGARGSASSVPADDSFSSQGLEPFFPKIILAQALPKGPKMDLIVRQATEAGVTALLPLISARSLSRGEEGGAARLARWERIRREALQQSGSRIVTSLREPLELSELPDCLASLGLSESSPRILLHETPLAQSSMHEYLTETSEAVALCVGPEGGFAQDEVDFLIAAGFRPLRLAGAVLRAETAALYAVAAARIILSERSSWIPKPR
jgi:16S rRNA (uracil1498-N3)-methyltransferase